MADHMKLYTIFIFTITACVFSLPVSASGDPIRGPFFSSINGPGVVMAGVPTEFTCSDKCTPKCVYHWNESGKRVEGGVMTVTASGRNESLQLECTAVNPDTNKSWTTTKTVKINNPVRVKPATSSDPQEGQSFTMTCQGSGPIVATTWLKDGQPLDTDARIQLSENNGMLSFRSLLPSDGGYFECKVVDGAITVISRGYLLSLGTIAVSILGPDTVKAGVEHIFTCQANCTLPCSTFWTFNQGFSGGSISSTRDVIRWIPATPGRVQSFQCNAQNLPAQRMAQASKRVTVYATIAPTNRKGATPAIKRMCDRMKSFAETRAGRTFEIFYPISYTSEKRGSMIYYIKVHVAAKSEDYVHLRLSKPSGKLQFDNVLLGQTFDDPITPFKK
ncbi:carcinoembryonic antigen-related cell adhesion molecule 1-like [Sardina pilchardus]|uniref:carcinoembryonic antigen-related cell adhesion molecule 1-like n=1 Tax=Sardina pilchardus TaxID=27697 RepID=UPI002E11333B